MILTRTLSVSEDEFYDHLENELLATIQECTSKELRASEIKKGLKYSKNEENINARIEVTILEYQRGKVYKSVTKSYTDTITLSFDTEVVADGLKVIFHQDIKSFTEKKQNKVMRELSTGIYLGRMSDTIYGIQEKVIKRRNTLGNDR